MYAYCLNNPTSFLDSAGTYAYNQRSHFQNNCYDASLPIGTNNYPITTSMGISASVTLGPIVYGAQVAVVTDSLGYSEIQFTYFSPLSSSAIANAPAVDTMLDRIASIDKATDVLEFSLMTNLSFFNAPLAENLHDIGYQAGCTIGTGPAIAVDYNLIPNGSNTPYRGITISNGFGSADVRGAIGVTTRLTRSPFSVYELAEILNNAFWGGH